MANEFGEYIGEDLSKVAENIIAGIENYLIKVFGFPKSVLVIFSKAAFSRPPHPVVTHKSFFELTWTFLNHIQDIVNTSLPISIEVIVRGDKESSWHVATQTGDDRNRSNEGIVQITASTDEVNRRIQSFIQRKQVEVDAYNKREFCVLPDHPQASTCARTDASFVPRQGEKSLLKIYRVCNKVESARTAPSPDDKQKRKSNPGEPWTPSHPSTTLALEHIPPAILARLGNLEDHVISKKDIFHPGLPNAFKDVHERIRKVENRVLYLEGLSPEYFKHRDSSIHDSKHRYSPYTLNGRLSSEKGETNTAAIDKRMEKLKAMLTSKLNKKSHTS